VAQPELIENFDRARVTYEQTVGELIPLVVRMAFESVADVLPGANEFEVHGEINEDWLPLLRIQRVLDASGEVLFDVEARHADDAVVETISEVNVEYLGLLIDLTGDGFMGAHTIDLPTATSSVT